MSSELEETLLSHFKTRELAKHELLIREGQYQVPLAFVDSGILRCFNETDDKEITNEFFTEQTFVTDYASLADNLPARFNIGAVEDASVRVILRETLYELGKQYPELQTWGGKMAERLFRQSLQKNARLKSASPEQRYRRMLEDKPEIIQRVPLRHIASYLGITPVHLSRIRKNL